MLKLIFKADFFVVLLLSIIFPLVILCLVPSVYLRLAFEESYVILLPSIVTMASTLGGIYIAVYFLTAQIRPLGVGNAALGVLYKELSPYSVMLTIAMSLVSSLIAMVDNLPLDIKVRLTAISIISVSYVVISLPLVALCQIKNLDKSFLASRVLKDFSVVAAKNYGLVSINYEGVAGALVHLETNGLNYERHDPLRAFHELVQQAIIEEDRLLLGKLVGALLSRSCDILGVFWQKDSTGVFDWYSRLTVRGYLRRISNSDQVAVIHQLHYLVRLSRNLHNRWAGLDVGRHGIQYQLAKFLACAASQKESHVCCMAAISAIIEVSRTYSDVTPYGRVEPLNALAGSLIELERNGRTYEVSYILDGLAMIEVNTSQLEGSRGEPLRLALSSDNRSRLRSRVKNIAEGTWPLIIDCFDPWKL